LGMVRLRASGARQRRAARAAGDRQPARQLCRRRATGGRHRSRDRRRDGDTQGNDDGAMGVGAMIERFDSVAALAGAYAAIRGLSYLASNHPDSWYGSETVDASLAYARHGNAALVPDAERLLAEIEAFIEPPARPWQASVAGAYPDVAAFLAGEPEC